MIVLELGAGRVGWQRWRKVDEIRICFEVEPTRLAGGLDMGRKGKK